MGFCSSKIDPALYMFFKEKKKGESGVDSDSIKIM